MLKRSERSQASILIVDADPASSAQVASLAASIGFHSVWRARSIERALRSCRARPFDVAIIDLVLGDRDGADLVLALRAWPGAVDYVVAAALDRDRLKQAADDRLPVDAFLQKPVHRHALAGLLAGRVRRSSLPEFDPSSEHVEID